MQPNPNPDWWTSVLQGVAGNAVWWILLGGLGVMVTVLKKKHSAWLSPVLYGLIGMILFGAVLYSGTMYARWPQVTPLILVLSLVIAAGLQFASARIEQKPHKTQGDDPAKQKELQDRLTTCQSELRHWKGEVERVTNTDREQIQIRDDQLAVKGGRIGELEEQLQVSQAMVDSLRNQLSAPNGRFKLKRVRYVATESRSLELRDVGKLPEKDLTEFFEDHYLENGKLVIPPGLYRKLFGPLNDPALGVPKILDIRFVHTGNEMAVLLPENISVTLPFPYAVTSEDMT